MSIATLKKKSQATYRTASTGQPQFTLQGTHRSQGFVGQESISRSLPRTPFRGTVPRGHGSSGGAFPINVVTYGSGTHAMDSPAEFKHATMTNNGMLANKLTCFRRPHPFSTTKSVPMNPIEHHRHCAIEASPPSKEKMSKDNVAVCSRAPPDTLRFAFKQVRLNMAPTGLYKDQVFKSQGEYIETMDVECTHNDVAVNQVTTHRSPFGCGAP